MSNGDVHKNYGISLRLWLRLSGETKREIQYVFVSHVVFVVGHPFHFEGVTHPMGITTLDSLVELFSWFWELGWGEMSHGDFFCYGLMLSGPTCLIRWRPRSSASLSYSHQNPKNRTVNKKNMSWICTPLLQAREWPFPLKKTRDIWSWDQWCQAMFARHIWFRWFPMSGIHQKSSVDRDDWNGSWEV